MAERRQKGNKAAPDVSNKGLPANEDAEKLVLGAILLDDKLFVQASAAIQPETFSLDRHTRIFRRMAELQERGEHIDRVTIANELMKFNEIESCGGLGYLISLDDGLPHIPNIDAYLRILKEKERLRQAIFSSQATINRALLGEEESSAILAGARESLLEIEAGATNDSDGPQSPGQIIEAMGGLNVFLGPRKKGLPTGFVKYDEMTGGLHPGELTILAARPAMGKSAMLLNIAAHAALRQDKGVMFFSLEMSKEELLYRLVCSEARVDSQRVRLNYLTREERTKLARAAAQITAARLYIDDKSAATAADLHARIRRKMADEQIDLVGVDYLQLMSGGRGYDNREQEVSAISRGLKLLAGEIKAPLVVLAQLNREPDKRKGNNRPQPSDLRESGSLEMNADVVSLIFRPEVYDKTREDLRGVAELIIGKQRSGPVGTVELVFLHNCTRFENRAIDLGESDPPPLLDTRNEQYAGIAN